MKIFNLNYILKILMEKSTSISEDENSKFLAFTIIIFYNMA